MAYPIARMPRGGDARTRADDGAQYGAAKSGEAIKAVRLWTNAFIPEVVFKKDGAKLTTTISSGKFAGKTELPGPLVAHYLTDQRGFSAVFGAKSRLCVWFDINAEANPPSVQEGHRCDATTEIGGISGAAGREDRGVADVDFSVTTAAMIISIKFSAEASNPFYKTPVGNISPSIKVRGTAVVDLQARRVAFAGFVNEFPAYEMYATINNRYTSGQELYSLLPAPGKTPNNLWGKANRPVSGATNFK